jgi:hypothetical protein
MDNERPKGELQKWLDDQFAYLIKLAKQCHDHGDNERLGRAISALLNKPS